jgi:hypothetical protein
MRFALTMVLFLNPKFTAANVDGARVGKRARILEDDEPALDKSWSCVIRRPKEDQRSSATLLEDCGSSRKDKSVVQQEIRRSDVLNIVLAFNVPCRRHASHRSFRHQW